jgi:hypothetical protein
LIPTSERHLRAHRWKLHSASFGGRPQKRAASAQDRGEEGRLRISLAKIAKTAKEEKKIENSAIRELGDSELQICERYYFL